MINKIKNVRLFNKSKKEAGHVVLRNLSDKFDPTQIIMHIRKNGNVIHCTPDQLWRLCSDNKELEIMGQDWVNFKADLIAERTITQADIDAEKIKGSVIAKIADSKIQIESEGLY